MAGELKACPFSGETPQTEYWSPSDGRHRDYASGAWIVTIKSSFVRVEKSSLLSMDDAESKAIAAWNTRAQLPSQVVEAVEVVAYHGKDPDGGEGFVVARWPNAFGREFIVEPLMTISQHQRILAASAHPADQVAFEALQHAVAYLSRSPMEAIHAGSALHKLMAQALAKP